MFNFLIHRASAHENYVLPQSEINAGMHDWSYRVFDALKDPTNLRIAIAVGLCSLLGVIAYFVFQHSHAGLRFDRAIKRFNPFGTIVLRIALAAAFLASAHFHAFLGPEIPSSSIIPFLSAQTFEIILYVLGILLLLGLFTEFVGAVATIIFIFATFAYKDYILTYFNYFGEFLALVIFGSYVFSIDRIFRRPRWNLSENFEIALIRITYGLSILYPAISIKLLHPIIIVDIVNQYHINKFHWLFPHDPLLVSLGTGLAQVAVGLAIIFGFQTRLNTLVTFVLMVMSVLFFKEAVWPHIILLALALYLMINNGGEWTLDNKIQKKLYEGN